MKAFVFPPQPTAFLPFFHKQKSTSTRPFAETPQRATTPHAQACVYIHDAVSLCVLLLSLMASDMSSAASVASNLLAESSSSAMSSSVEAVVAAQETTGWFGFLGWLIISVFNIVSTLLYWSIRIVTITIPSVLYALFSASWTVTMNATTLILIFAAVISAASWVVRYRILNMYSRLPPEPQRKEPEIDLFPDTHEEGVKSGFSNYLDEFLSAIKIFGYLERSVFHELTRSMQTRKLIAGETINLEEEKGFCIVVDGLVEIFVKSDRVSRTPRDDDASFESSDEEEEMARGHQRYHVLTEVRNGAPMSSLFSIMSLFTEDVKLQSSSDDSADADAFDDNHHPPRTPPTKIPASLPNSPQLDSNVQARALGRGHDARAYANLNAPNSSSIPPMSLDGPLGTSAFQRPRMPNRSMSSSAHPDIIARATKDTTIAIIPASAFRRLIKIYPKATAHIVHVILSRFQRVTLSHAFNYLGLTSEVLQMEKNVLKHTTCQLPNVLRGDPLTRLKEKFKRERERVGEDHTKGIALHNAGATSRRRRSSAALRKEAVLHALAKQRPSSMMSNAPALGRDRGSLQFTSPGDLLTNFQLSRNTIRPSPAVSPIESRKRPILSPLDQRTNNPFDSERHARVSLDARESADEDNLFRASILECMFKTLGLDGGGTASREPESVEASPRLVSIDQRRTKAVFSNNAFGIMGPFESSLDGETESVTSGGLTGHSPPSAHLLANDMKNEVEIVFFPKGSVLVEQGERSPGLYYVVDGFLDIGTENKKGSHDLLQKTDPRGQFFRTASNADRDDDDNTPPSPGRKSVALVKPGGLAGYIGSVSSYRSFIDVVAKTDVYVGFLPRASLERIVDRYPIILLTMAKRLTNILPRLILHIDFALEWVQVNAGQVIFHNADESDAIYIVLNGRLRLVEDHKDGKVVARAEFGQGESVGELEVLTETARSGTLHAIRDTELVKFPRSLFNSLAQEHPNITIKISKIIASRMRSIVDDPAKYLGKEAGSGAITNQRKSTINLRTVALLPVTAGVPIVDFGHRLMAALSQVGPPNGATSLNQAAILNHLGKHAFNKMGKLRLSQYLADLEEKYGLVVYVAGKTSLFFSVLLLSTRHHDDIITHDPKAQPLMVIINSNFFLNMSIPTTFVTLTTRQGPMLTD